MKPTNILIVDDTAENIDLLKAVLESRDYAVKSAANGAEALKSIEESMPDLVVLDVMMPEMSGYEVCQAIRQKPQTALLPVVMLTALDPSSEKVKGIEAGADDFLSKPINQAELLARVDSLLRIAGLQKEIADKNRELLQLNQDLEKKVAKQVEEIESLNKLKRSLPADVATKIVSDKQEGLLQPHRKEITIVFFELRGFGNLVMDREPEEVMIILSEFHQILGKLISQFNGTVQRFSCDEIVIFFNDPIPVDNAPMQAINLAKRFQTAFTNLKVRWSQKGYNPSLSIGVGVATGFATLGMMGFEGREDYTAIGAVTEIVSRLCREAKAGEILMDVRTQSRLNADSGAKPRGSIMFKDIDKSIEAFKIAQ
jgi:DNA-binding response OmpR family regulator